MLRFTLILMGIMFLFGSCEEDNDPQNHQDQISGNDFELYSGVELYYGAVSNRSDDISDAFEIVSAKIDNGNLYATLSYNGSCEKNRFQVIWSGSLMESYPYQARLAIKRNAANCTSNNGSWEANFSVDLVELIGDIVLEEPIIFHLINCSTDDNSADVSVQNFE